MESFFQFILYHSIETYYWIPNPSYFEAFLNYFYNSYYLHE